MFTPSIDPYRTFSLYDIDPDPLAKEGLEESSFEENDLLSFSILEKAGSEILHLDKKDEYKVEQAFIFWTNISFTGADFEAFQEGEDKTRFVEKMRNWCKKNEEMCLKVGYLSITNCNIESMPEDIKYFKNLKELDAFGNKLKDISAISKLKKLEILSLQHNEIKDVPAVFFNEMSELKEVFIYGNRIKDLAELINSISKRSFKIAAHSQEKETIKDEDWIFI